VIVLVGFMGAGKSTVGRLVATSLGCRFVDLDELIERRAGASIPELFATRGEPYFRALERAVASEVLAAPDAVVALGGGAVEDECVRAALGGATTIHLDVAFEQAMARVGDGAGRPLLARTDPRTLYGRRRDAYRRVASLSIMTDGRTAEEVADEVVRAVAERGRGTRRITARTPSSSYDIVVGSGVAGDLADYVPELPDAEVAFLVTHRSLRELAAPAAASLATRGLRLAWGLVPEGEEAKTLEHARALHEELARAGAHSHDLVVAFGGGVVCDLAGFVASTYHRGVAVAHVPTTLLAQVDAAIGGKTGVNLSLGKNLVGTIHQPVGVLCDVSLLTRLPVPELRSGMAEVVKYGLIADPSLLDIVASRADDILGAEQTILGEIVYRCAAIKAGIVERDEREHGERAYLNYGHTFAHAIEHASGFTIRHGEAVALGMMAAAHLAADLGRIDEDAVAAQRRALEAVELPTRARCDLDALERAWRQDKKYRGGVRFVLLSALGNPEAGIAAPRDAVERALERLAS
jgi:shikimate kinase/3-dehydroquinate synthase